MSLNINIRPVIWEDLPALKTAIAANDLFPAEMLDDMMSDYFNNSDSQDIWFTYVEDKPVAIGFLMQSLQWGEPPQRAASLTARQKK